MYCPELDRLLEQHSELTMEYFRQDARTQDFYASDEEWVSECKRLAALQEQLERVSAEVAQHRSRHRCGGAEPGVFTSEGTPRLRSGQAPDAEELGRARL
jgi:hypothetical protein